MDKDFVVFDVEEGTQGEILEFAAFRIRNGQIQATCHFLVFEDHRQAILDFFEDAILIAHRISSRLGMIEKALRVHIQPPFWDTLELAQIFFPTAHHYQLSYLAEKLSLPLKGESYQNRSELNTWLTWKLFEACWKKGLKFDLSFFDHAMIFLEGWAGRGFIDELRREITRSFPDRQIRTDLALATGTEGLFECVKSPAVSIPDSIDWVVDCFSPEGILERNLPDFESRPGQVKMAKVIAEGFRSSRHVVVEAGTGTGKSLAYLIPSLWSAKITGRKVVIATHTIPLQEQLQNKDIPILKKVLPFPFRVAILKGKGNYCCLKKWQGCLANPTEISRLDCRLAFLSILVWLRETHTGDLQELSKVPGLLQNWPSISADNEMCIPGRCSKAGVCFLLRARKKAEESDLLIVNHSLLFSDLKTDYNVLPEHHNLVVDEAHQMYQTALQHLGSELSQDNLTRRIDSLFRKVGPCFYTTIKQRLLSLSHIIPSVSWDKFEEKINDIPELCTMVVEQSKELFQLLLTILGTRRTFRLVASDATQKWWEGLKVQIENLLGRTIALRSVLEGLIRTLNEEDADEIEELRYELSSHQRELQELTDTLNMVLNINNPLQVTWIELNTRLYLKTTPIEVSDILKEKIFARLDTVILTSATLSISNSFRYFLKDIGLPLSTTTSQVDSPFDYDQQMKFFVVRKGINHQSSDYEKAVDLSKFISEVAERMNGRTLVLFTAHKLLNETYDLLHQRLARIGIDTLAQGVNGERSTIIEAFKRNQRSVLLGANSFWEGIDIQGDALSCIILVKLPFWPPSLPLIEARSEYMSFQGRDPFRELLLPEAVIRFKQGFGRLIRSKKDRGIVVLLDDRVIDKYYGRYFLGSLPIQTHIRGENAFVLGKIQEWNMREVNQEL
ncbi:MAG: helicase C-terminal domain-containing protein [Bacillota bacterium]|nr:helicase C-terminal domain-containing protein [Bacillota bacterium]